MKLDRCVRSAAQEVLLDLHLLELRSFFRLSKEETKYAYLIFFQIMIYDLRFIFAISCTKKKKSRLTFRVIIIFIDLITVSLVVL